MANLTLPLDSAIRDNAASSTMKFLVYVEDCPLIKKDSVLCCYLTL